MSQKRSSKSAGADNDDSFEIDIDEEQDTRIEDVFEEAIAAVDRGGHPEEEGESDAAEGSGNSPSESGAGGSKRVEELEAKVASLREQLARTLADFDNHRKRTEREKESLRRFALFDPLRDFLEVVDNIERALAASGSAEDLKLGLQMTVRQLESLLERYGVEPVSSVGEPFDPNVHEAVSRQESPEVESATVIQEMQKGYVLHGRLLRPAMVAVAMPVDGGSSRGEDAESEVETSRSEAAG